MRLSFRLRDNSTASRSSTRRERLVKELRADVKELIETVLPCFENRPSLYNAAAQKAQQLNEDMQALVLAEKETNAGNDSRENNDDINHTTLTVVPVQFLPQNETSLEELEKDRTVLNQLLETPERKQVRSLLLAIRCQIETDLKTYHMIQTIRANEALERLTKDRQILSFVLDKIEDRRHIHAQIVQTMLLLTDDPLLLQDNEVIRASSSSTPALSRLPQQQRKRFGSCDSDLNESVTTISIRGDDSTQALSVVDDNSNNKNDSETIFIDTACAVDLTTATAADRWEDVLRLDELIDVVPETSLALYELLGNLKDVYREEAKVLQRAESPRPIMVSLDSTVSSSSTLDSDTDSHNGGTLITSSIEEETSTVFQSPLLGSPPCFGAEYWA